MTVSNSLASVIPTLYARGLMALRHNAVMPRLVLNDFAEEVKQKGEIIQIPLPSAIATQAVVPAAYAPDPGNLKPTTAQIPLDSWYEAPFALSEKELAQIVDGIVPIQLSAAVEALATQINLSILNLYQYVTTVTGTPGTTPFVTDVTAATKAGAALTTNLAPNSDRHMVLDPTAYGTALALPAFYGALYGGNTDMVKEGFIGRKFGFDWTEDQSVPTDTLGTITTGLIAKASTGQAIGTTAILCTTAASTGACALKAGNLVVFAGDTQAYSLTADATQATAATGVTLNITPGKVVALTGSEAVTLVNSASATVNLAFHRQAFAFASRPLAKDNLSRPIDMEMMVPDPQSGITMRLTVREEFHRTRFAFDCLWGAAPVRPLLACRVQG